MNQNISLNIDKSNTNFYLVTMTLDSDEGKITGSDLKTLFIMLENFFNNCASQNIKFVQHFDIVKMKNITLNVILEFCTFFKKIRDVFIKNALGTTLTIGDGIAKRFFNLFLAYYDPVRPIALVNSPKESMSFGEECFNGKHENSSIIM